MGAAPCNALTAKARSWRTIRAAGQFPIQVSITLFKFLFRRNKSTVFLSAVAGRVIVFSYSNPSMTAENVQRQPFTAPGSGLPDFKYAAMLYFFLSSML